LLLVYERIKKIFWKNKDFPKCYIEHVKGAEIFIISSNLLY